MTGMDERLAKVAEVLGEHVAHYHGGSGHAVCDCEGWEFWGTMPDFMKASQRHQAQAFAPLLDEWQAEDEARALRERGIDPTPDTVGEDYHHKVRGGRICRWRANGSGWWPLRWEDGQPNLSGGSFCLMPHPYRAALGAGEPDAGAR